MFQALDVKRLLKINKAAILVLVSIPILLGASPSRSEGTPERLERLLFEDIDFYAVCLESPYENGWIVAPGVGGRVDQMYHLLVYRGQADVLSAETKNNFRFVVRGQPCFYEFRSFGTGNYGSLVDSSGPGRLMLEIDGATYLQVFQEEFQRDITLELLKACRAMHPFGTNFPFYPFEDCSERIDEIFSLLSTSLAIFPNPVSSDGTFPNPVTLDIVMGRIYRNGRLISQW